ncbi:cobalt ABC transporter permease [Shewanella mangrovi]|uniref:Cobalt ABC transporter permease n=1 Tax=Shewanella mangrovi TaxID=1515746 RepID=A0A094JEA6_9GAMM|nr:energy-coupling factor transporter transmembrane component T [Shewanella mangrovi]KFZ37587.1 cobalt ABC transporter permease [Shewanella mangrovi]
MPVSHFSRSQATPISSRSLWFAGTAMVLALLLSSAAFFVPQVYLPWLAGIDALLVLHGVINKGNLGGLLRYILLQLLFTMVLYLAIHGGNQVGQGVMAVARILLALLPGWWLTSTVSAEAIGELLSKVMPSKWAFVIVASINLLPFMVNEAREIYQLQLLRGARISPKQLLNPRNWSELCYCVLFPLLVQLLKLAQQTATAARARHFGHKSRRTHWRPGQSENGNK